MFSRAYEIVRIPTLQCVHYYIMGALHKLIYAGKNVIVSNSEARISKMILQLAIVSFVLYGM